MRLLAPQPAGHPAIGLDEPVVADGKDRRPQAGQDLIRTLRPLSNDGIQAAERGDDLGLDEDRVARAVEDSARHGPPAEIGLGQPVNEGGLDRGLRDVVHAEPSRKRS